MSTKYIVPVCIGITNISLAFNVTSNNDLKISFIRGQLDSKQP